MKRADIPTAEALEKKLKEADLAILDLENKGDLIGATLTFLNDNSTVKITQKDTLTKLKTALIADLKKTQTDYLDLIGLL